MNGRTVRKILARGAGRNIWGRRAFLTVRLPMEMFPEPFPTGELPRSYVNGDIEVSIHCAPIFTGGDPRTYSHELDDGFVPEIHFVEKRKLWDTDEEWEFWEGWTTTMKVNPSNEMDFEVISRENLPVEVVGLYRAQSQWVTKYLEGRYKELSEPIASFAEARGWAATTYQQFSKDFRYVYYTYSIKNYHHDSMKSFCASIHKAMAVSKRHGLDTKLMHCAEIFSW